MAERASSQAINVEVTPVGLLEIDRTVYSWVNDKHSTVINGRRVPVVFGSWERWAQIPGNREDENLNSQRDAKGMLKLPIISINRGDVTFNDNLFVRKDQNNFPSVVITKRIATSQFNNSERVAFNTKYQVAGGRYKSEEAVYETHEIPYPDFIDLTYTINFWANYVSHVNRFHEMVWQDAYPSDLTFEGHRFYASIKTQSDIGNQEDFSGEERIIRHTFNMDVTAYLMPRENVKINRTGTKIVMDENAVDAYKLESERNGTPLTLDEIINEDTTINIPP